MLLAAASATSLAAQSTFEGAISMTLGSESGRSMDVTYMLKDGKLRMEMAGVRGGAGATLILDVEHKQVFTLVPERRIYTVLLVTKIDRKSLDGALFAPPEGYMKMDLDAMLKRP